MWKDKVREKEEKLRVLQEELARLRSATRQSVDLHVFERIQEWRKGVSPDPLPGFATAAIGQNPDSHASKFEGTHRAD